MIPNNFLPFLGDTELLKNAHIHAVMSRLPFITEGKKMVIALQGVEDGDSVCLIVKTRAPFVLLKAEGGYYELMGESYCHSLMNGEEMRELDDC
jgi:hypothetical protein